MDNSASVAMNPMSPKLENGLFHNKKFIQLWISSFISGLSLSIYLLTETWYVVDKLHLATLLGVVLMATTLPQVILMIFGGVMADRFNPSFLMFLSASIRGLLMVCMILALMFQLLTIWVVFLFALVFGILDAFFWPASGSIVPSIVNKHELTRANSLFK